MSNFDVFLCLLFVGIVGFQVHITRRVHKTPLFDREQKANQMRLIWLLPLIGSVIVYTVLRDEDEATHRPRSEQSGRPRG